MKLTETEFQYIQKLVHKEYGIYLTDKKRTLIESRFSNQMEMRNFKNFSEYFQLLKDDKTGNEMIDFVNRITTNHTYFFREDKHYTFLKNVILPDLIKTERSRDLRIWSAGCSSGEEAYSTAMLIDDFFGGNKYIWDSQILATDISVRVLNQAVIAKYTVDEVEKLDKYWTKKYFKKNENEYEIVDTIKKEVIFRKFNLTHPFHFKKKFHLIFCRNVMIYFEKSGKDEILKKFYDALLPGGYLFIGHSETIENKSIGFKFIEPAIYQKE